MFEFDPVKSAINKDKHGIDFVEAQALWSDGDAIDVPSSQSHHGEDRGLRIGQVGGRIWTAIVTDRDGVIRIMSVRRSRNYEEEAYERARAD